MKNFSSKWIDGSTNHKTSVIVDYASSDQHKAAMNHSRSSLSVPITEYSPIARGSSHYGRDKPLARSSTSAI